MTDLDKAISLREQGWTYPEISSALNGAFSVDQLKRKLKGITKGEKKNACVEELISLATRPQGITIYEANGIIMKHHPDKELSYDQLKYIRDKAKAADNRCVFRPGWIATEDPQQSYKSFLTYVIHIQDEIDNAVRWYCDTYPSANPQAVHKELMFYIKPSINSEPLSTRIGRTEELLESMEEISVRDARQKKSPKPSYLDDDVLAVAARNGDDRLILNMEEMK